MKKNNLNHENLYIIIHHFMQLCLKLLTNGKFLITNMRYLVTNVFNCYTE